MASFTYPTSAELRLIAQDYLARLTQDRLAFEYFPLVTSDFHLVKWEQLDNYQGLQQVRGLNGEPAKVKRLGIKQYEMVPGCYGEFVDIDEQELTTRRKEATFGDPITIDDLVTQAEEQLLVRELDRIELIIWALLANGTFAVAGPNGAILHQDSYTTQTFTASVTWATSATATPLANFRAIQLLQRGHGVSFGAGAEAVMNRVTFNNLVTNTNNNDLAGRRVTGLLSPLNLEEINRILLGEDLPQIRVYDEGYIDETNTFVPFLANGKFIVVGKRKDNATVGEYQLTRNVNNPDMAPGSYTLIEDSMDHDRPPRRIRVHRGHNGGPGLFFPSAIVQGNA